MNNPKSLYIDNKLTPSELNCESMAPCARNIHVKYNEIKKNDFKHIKIRKNLQKGHFELTKSSVSHIIL